MPHYNISPAVLSENPFPVRKSKDHTPYSYAVIQRMYSKGYNGVRLEVARAANGVLVTSTDAIVRYELAINTWAMPENNGIEPEPKPSEES